MAEAKQIKSPNSLTDWYYTEVNYPFKQPERGAECTDVYPFVSTEIVYVVYNDLTKLTKIGITTNIKKRIRQLSNQNGCDIKLFQAIELEINYDESANYIESKLHNYFKDKRKVGEWFDLSLKDYVEIKNLFRRIDGCWIWRGEEIYYKA